MIQIYAKHENWWREIYIYIYIYICVCVCVCVYIAFSLMSVTILEYHAM